MWVPPKVAAEYQQERHQADAEIQGQVMEQEFLSRWSAELQRIDPHLEMVRAHENATVPGLKPGYYHVLRRNPGAPVSIHVLEHQDGSFREPGSWVYDWLAKGDMWSNRAMKARRKRELEDAKAKERARERELEERADELLERLQALNRVSAVIR